MTVDDSRQETCLNGTWKLEVDGHQGLHDVRVPGSFAGQYKLWGKEHWNTWDYPQTWFDRAATCHKSFSVPETLDGQRVLIRFNGVRHVVSVKVNGKEAGTWSDSYVPFSFDITDLVMPGENALAVHIGEETTCGLFEDYNSARRGIYRDVFLQIVPEVRVDNDAHLQTLLQEKRLNYALPLRNDGAASREVRLRFSITDPDGVEVKQWQSADTLVLEAGETTPIETAETWEDPHLWGIDDPYLYYIHTEILDASSGELLDHHSLRFGFREITWHDAKLYLNGEELYLRGNGNHPMGDLEGGRPFAEAMIRHLKAHGVQSMRMHDLARHQEMYEVGDELGFLFIAEASHHFRLPPENVARAHMERFVKYLWNHPSVMAWSVSNELHWRKFEEPAYLIELCNRLDPTRPAFASDFTLWSLHGNVVAHHYSPETLWSDWLEYGKDKAMIWDELGSVWQHDRNLDTGPAGYEIYGQDVATGIYRDGVEIINNLKTFADGKMVDGELRRVSCYMPWEFGYNFFRFQPFNNMRQMVQSYDQIEGTRGIKIDSVMPGASTTNIWDPTLPPYQPNPALYCFKDFLECVRFPDDPQERTYFGGEAMELSGRMFYETHTPVDRVAFRVEALDGAVLTENDRSVTLRPGAYVEAFLSTWELPPVDACTPVRLVRQFSLGERVIYRQLRDIKLCPRRQVADLLPANTAVLGEKLQEFFGCAGADPSKADLVITDMISDELAQRIRSGARLLRIALPSGKALAPPIAKVDLDEPMESVGKEFVYRLPHPVPLEPEGWFRIRNHQTTKVSGKLNPEQPWLEERALWSSSPEAYQPQFRIVLRAPSGDTVVTSDETPLMLSRVQCAPAQSEERFLLSDFDWRRDGPAGEGVSLEALPPVSEVVMVQTGLSGPEVRGRLLGMTLCGYTKPGAVFPTNGARPRFMEGLGEEDLALWRGGSAVEALRLPTGTCSRRFLFGNKHGRGSSLHEWYAGEGIAMETSLNLIASFDDEPMAGEMLSRCLTRLQAFELAGESLPVGVIGDEALLAYYTGLGVDCELLAEPEGVGCRPLLIVGASTAADAARLKAWQSELKQAVAAGVTALFSPLTEETIAVVREIAGRSELSLTEPFFHKNTYCIKAPVSWARVGTPEALVDYYDGVLVPYPFEPNGSPLLSGIANIDLNWAGKPMFDRGVELEGMDPVAASADCSILISNWHINSEPGKSIFGEMLNGVRDLRQNSWFINRDPVVFQVSGGEGAFIFNQLELQNGGEQADRLMVQLLTQLGAPIAGAVAPPDDEVYDLSPQAEQLDRFAVYAAQIEPGRRQYYGIPKPMPAFLKETRIEKTEREVLPVLGFVGDGLSLQLATAVAEKLSDVLQASKTVEIARMSEAAVAFSAGAGYTTWDRCILSLGNTAALEEQLPPDRFADQLRALYSLVKDRAQQVFWLPPAPAPAMNTERSVLVAAYEKRAEEVFGGDEVYMVPFVYDGADRVLYDYLHGDGLEFSLQEVRDLSESLAQAIRSFGAM